MQQIQHLKKLTYRLDRTAGRKEFTQLSAPCLLAHDDVRPYCDQGLQEYTSRALSQ